MIGVPGEPNLIDGFDWFPVRQRVPESVIQSSGYTIERWFRDEKKSSNSLSKEECEELWQQFLNSQSSITPACGMTNALTRL